MTNKFHLSSIALLVSIAVTGCANKQTWSPELEEARKAFEQVSSDPLVPALAAAELDKAKKQLQVAEDASDYFKGNEVIAHEATLATLKAFEAQQTARALAAKDNLRLAQSGAPISANPIMAAAAPQAPKLEATYVQSSGGAVSGGSNNQSALTETQLIAQQLAALSEQIIQLQQRIESGAMQSNTQAATSYIAPTQSIATASYEASSYEAGNAIDTSETQLESYTDLLEPQVAAAIATPDAPETLSDARLYEELRAMNARPSDRGMELTLGERYFEADSARIWQGRAARHLDNIAAVMAENPALVLDVQAHTDNSGDAEVRKNLSSDRATAVKSALVLRGVNASRISAAGYSDLAPVADNNTQLGRLQNRRVEIIFPNVAAQ